MKKKHRKKHTVKCDYYKKCENTICCHKVSHSPINDECMKGYCVYAGYINVQCKPGI